MKELVLYIHGKGGCAGESEHYKPLFPECEVVGLDYKTFTPWETGKEIREAVIKLNAKYDSIVLIANSIGAYFCMNAGIDSIIRCAYFISPVVDMESLIPTSFGEHWFHTDEQMRFLDKWIMKGRSIQ